MSLLTRPTAWTVLDTCFGSGEGLVAHLQARRASHQPSALLHYVAVCESVPRLGETASAANPSPLEGASRSQLSRELGTDLSAAFSGALPGFQRFLLAQGQVSLTLCVGLLRQMLSEQQFQADEVHLRCDVQMWDKWSIQLLARRCKRGTVLKMRPLTAVADRHGTVDEPLINDSFAKAWACQGFVWQSPNTAVYAPAWELRSTRRPGRATPPEVRRCAVVGGGLSGAAVAYAMAQRGWSVTVLDSHTHCAEGGSGLPVGLLVPHVSVDDSPRSRLSRVGISLTLQHARRLLRRGEDWDDVGALELTRDAQRQLDASPSLIQAGWLEPGSRQATAQPWADGVDWAHSLWHPRAGWIKPERLVRAWLSAPGIEWRGGAPVCRMERVNGVWILYRYHSDVLAQAEVVVIANAFGAAPLLNALPIPWQGAHNLQNQLKSLQALHGSVSFGSGPALRRDQFPPFPVNGSGSLVCLDTGASPTWFVGATYELDATQLANHPQQHAINLQRLKAMLPAVEPCLSKDFSDANVATWTGTRCVSHDRLPLVGSVGTTVESGLWISTAMGSRGLSFAALCAELLAARLGGEPLPVEARLARSLDANRPMHRHR